MATIEECRAALHKLAARLAANADETREKLSLDRTLACRIRDLGAAFHARLLDGRLVDIADGDNPSAKIAMSVGSDDLVALVDGRLDFGRAWAGGKVSVDASMFDLLKLRKLL